MATHLSGANRPQGHQVSFKPLMSKQDKKIRSLKKKLEDISKLKEKKASGMTLEVNQLNKIESEHTILQELQQLRVSSAEQVTSFLNYHQIKLLFILV